MSKFDLKSALVSIAPTLATMLGSPLAGAAVTALESAFGLTAGVGTDGITKVVQGAGMTPEIISAVRAADQKHAEIIAQQGIDLEKLSRDYQTVMAQTDAGDRDSARKREMAIKDGTPAALAYMIIGGFFVVSIVQLIALMGYAEIVSLIPSQGWLLIGNISGYLANEAKAASSYYFGTTQDSGQKTEMLYKSQPAQQPEP